MGTAPDRHKAAARRRRFPFFLWAAVVLLALVAAGYTTFQVSPWPGATLIRAFFTLDARRTARVLEKHVPENVSERLNIRYSDTSEDTYLDLFFPSDVDGSDRQLPTVVWIHGGGWVSGNKDDVDNYARIIAGKGYTVASVNYSLAPRARYPTPVRQAAMALAYLREHAQGLHIDPLAFVLAGDSAGAHIAAQLANAIAVPSYARELGISAPIPRRDLAGLILYCGAYDLKLVDFGGPFHWFLKTVLWSYTGEREFLRSPRLASASVIDYITADFPPAYLSAGNGDPLERQSRLFAKALADRGVLVETLFFPQDYSPALRHEYQFKLDTPAAQQALQSSLEFLSTHTTAAED